MSQDTLFGDQDALTEAQAVSLAAEMTAQKEQTEQEALQKSEDEDSKSSATAKKTARKKATTKKAATAKKTTAAKKTAAKKTSTKKATAKKSVGKKASEKKASAEKADDAQEADAAEQQQAPKKKVTRRKRVTKKTKKADADAASEEKVIDSSEAEAEAEAETETETETETATAEQNQDTAQNATPASEEAASADAAASDAAEASDSEEEQSATSRRKRRTRRNGNNSKQQRQEIVPSATRDELASLEDEDLVAKSALLGVDTSEYGERDDLVSAVYDALLQSEGFVQVEGILDILPDGYGFIRTEGYLPGEHDAYVGSNVVRRNGLRKGDYISGRVRPPRGKENYPALNTILMLNGEQFEGPKNRVKFSKLTPIYPDERLVMEHGAKAITARSIDLLAPIGKGQRGLIVSPPKAGKTTVLKDIAAAISANDPDVHLMCLLVDERPEEVTDMERSINGEVVSSTFDMPCESHIAVAELVIERAKRLVEQGKDVVILLDSITRLARAYNLGQPASGRVLSGGVDSSALYPPKRFLGAARNIEFGGSLTILGTALIETGSKMDEVIFEEFKGTGNMELKLDRGIADKRIFPAIDPVASGTRKEELLIDPQEAPLIWGMRRLLANMAPERAMEMLINSLHRTETNREFLIKSAKKAQRNAAVKEAF